ncbi:MULTISPECIES: carboxylating nicotinate-nucleotide diphosphorylase [unclassified Candidatus Frackibacter]|uniref:carboxylating nicotinate-nucleotide diphosphorylase n=1 Tax=unclassified Candidatus Frackibacter TaxID=2648818 RepID=UPI0007920B69|nr:MULTISPECIES: carboxylating nicotinate-nucleotide diphosphorylase [unclassified Candidatus Frackibacter]KXS45631.1 MAG: nicotinate-nucleotide pyrophosphorylase [Candidatus Frackibacter sp. T328-2]SDC59442.1 nicotinate-nucleotide pyrophosphorylase [carboxylating] [Candidatus Frackibacter sp. WG11]SEM42334.1 nicotinate-nucleotide pyrophosphorylase [carboxylating] [Candidatus Frackibacter sp. WG12]SFL85176.1 nicotinate-nucleotide pyrophosphorylase [carboxylating] [Candidatus Frackibacter sp. WG
MNLNKKKVLEIIDNAINEDIWTGDITTEAVVNEDCMGEGILLAKESGVIAGLEVAKLVFQSIDNEIKFQSLAAEGDYVKSGTEIAQVRGKAKSILTAERLALNFLQRMSGIATKTAKYEELVGDYDVRIVDTRKTTPGLRILEKYAVQVGGGDNHRLGLYDAVMIKDNHISAAGGIKEAVEKARTNVPHTMKIEVETESLDEVKEAVAVNADIIMLDNMSTGLMKEAVELVDNQTIVEASGGITAATIKEVAATGVDVISLGTLTHTIKSLDINLDLKV